MIAHWPTLRDWIAESRATETARRRIERDAADWEQRGRDRGDLYRRHRLADALDVTTAHENELTRTGARFLTAARRRRLAARLAFTMAIVLALTGVAWLAKTPVRDAWLRYEAQSASPQVRVSGGIVHMESGFQPTRVINLLADKHEVTNQQYRYCVDALACAAPLEPAGYARFADGDLHYPVVYVTAYDAANFCSWLGRRLPTEAEWLLIAIGTDGRPYPWGRTKPVRGQANGIVPGYSPKSLVPADSQAFPDGVTKDKAEQVLGNAAEWTATLAHRGRPAGTWNGHNRVRALLVMGGGYKDSILPAQTAVATVPYDFDEESGFRCVTTR